MAEDLLERVDRLHEAMKDLLAAYEGLHDRVTALEKTARVNISIDAEAVPPE